MTRCISVLNFKGGTGKTTTVVNLGMALALRGNRVLALDFDPQGSVAEWLGMPTDRRIDDVLVGKKPWFDQVTRARVRFDIIAADRSLGVTEQNLLAEEVPASALAEHLYDMRDGGYDYILIDCAPYVSLLSECALLLSSEVIVPVSMEYLALVGARDVIIEVLRARRLSEGNSAQIALIVPSFYYDRHIKSRETVAMLSNRFPGMVSEPIRASVKLSEAPSHQRTIFEYDPDGTGSQDYAMLAEQIVARGAVYGSG